MVQPVTKNMFRMLYSRELQKRLYAALALGSLLCGAALAQSARTSYQPGTNFSKYHTYRWVEVKGQHPDPAVDAQIKQAIDSQLAKKGLTKTNDSTADLNVDYQTAITTTQEWQNYEDWTQTGLPGMNMTQQKQVTIKIGTLVVDMYDSAAKQLVWSGRAHKALDTTSSQKERQKNINNAAKSLLNDFPPK